MLPMTVLRRFDCVLASAKAKVLAEYARRKGGKVEGKALDQRLNKVEGQCFKVSFCGSACLRFFFGLGLFTG